MLSVGPLGPQYSLLFNLHEVGREACLWRRAGPPPSPPRPPRRTIHINMPLEIRLKIGDNLDNVASSLSKSPSKNSTPCHLLLSCSAQSNSIVSLAVLCKHCTVQLHFPFLLLLIYKYLFSSRYILTTKQVINQR